jgi:DNA processing protein
MERAAWVALSSVPGLGPARFRRLLDEFGTALDALRSDPQKLCDLLDLPDEAAAQVREIGQRLESVSEQVSTLDEIGVRPLIWADAEYPSRLRATSSPPPVLWWTGRADLNGPAVAVVGSREVSEEAIRLTAVIAGACADQGALVVSGLAAGVDAAAHEAAVEAGGQTVGVCGCGLATALTKGRQGLAGRVADSGGLCSELAPSAPLLPQSLFARDRIIAGLAQAVIVVEARASGGAVHTGKCALKEGRPVLAVEWPYGHAAPGNRELLAEGARPLPAAGEFKEQIGGLIAAESND